MLEDSLVATVLAGLAVAAFWWIAPRCPECGFLLSSRDGLDPSLRHCRRCMTIFRKENRR
jgi:tRNA(Ile2) C34 agmatinyltransferase TiaS